MLTGALGLLPLSVLVVQGLDRSAQFGTSWTSNPAVPLSPVAAVFLFAGSIILAAAYRHELRIDPGSQAYLLRIGFPILSRPRSGNLCDIERIRVTPEKPRHPGVARYNVILDWRVSDRPAFCLAESLDHAATDALTHQLSRLSLQIAWDA